MHSNFHWGNQHIQPGIKRQLRTETQDDINILLNPFNIYDLVDVSIQLNAWNTISWEAFIVEKIFREISQKLVLVFLWHSHNSDNDILDSESSTNRIPIFTIGREISHRNIDRFISYVIHYRKSIRMIENINNWLYSYHIELTFFYLMSLFSFYYSID